MCLAYLISSLCTGIPLLGFFSDAAFPIVLGHIGTIFILAVAFTSICTAAAMLCQNKISLFLMVPSLYSVPINRLQKTEERIAIKKGLCLEVSDIRAFALAADQMGLEYHILSDTQAEIFSKITIINYG